MDFGVVGLDELVCSENSAAAAATGFASSLVVASDTETKQNLYGSGFHKQERSAAEDDWRGLKVAKTNADDFSASKAITTTNTMLLHHRSPSLRSNVSLGSDGQQILSFSSPNSQTVTLPYYHHTTSTPYTTRIANAGYGSGGLNPASMHGVVTGARGPFTPSQWMELEHQALIYKYITANAPIPSNLLIPIKKALDSAGFSSLSCLRPNPLGWGAFHLGFSNSTDPEPGRCRRTDGKKWRCSRDAVADQKYCERHMNRGRHRSRKPVEGQTGHSVSGSTATTTSQLVPVTSSASASVVTGGDTSSSLGLSHHQLNNLQPGALNSATNPNFNRSFLDKEKIGEGTQNVTGLSLPSPTIGLRESQIPPSNKQNPWVEFGLVSSDSLLNPMHRSSTLFGCQNNGSSEDLNGCQSRTKSHQSLHQFMDDWPKSVSERSALVWPDIDVQSDRTQLSISIPMASSDFMSSTSSPSHEKLAPSPLRLSCELESTQMVLGVGTVLNEPNQRHTNWIPISWETSMGGPLGEVLHSTNNSASDSKNSSALNLMTEGWDSSPSMASSPTGVLQKVAFRSLSNSSAGSSPRAENSKTHERASLCHGLLGSNLTNPSLPAL